MRLPLSMLLCLLISSPATSETLEFAIYRLSDSGQELIAEGKRNYTLSDIEVTPREMKDGYADQLKILHLKEGFAIGIMVVRLSKDSGFGLWIHEYSHPGGFSWEWFSHEDGDIFTKAPDIGRVRVTHVPVERGFEIRSIEFLTDVTMQFQRYRSLPPGQATHEVVVSKGSIFRVAP